MDNSQFNVGDSFAKRFILISIFYFIVGTLWMGPMGFLIPGPSGNAGTFYDTGRLHVVFVGFVAFLLIGGAYYLVPRIGGKQIYSKRLANIHFWMTNILFPFTVVLIVSLTVYYQNVLNSPTFSFSNMPTVILMWELVVIIIMFIGIGAQGVLAFNIYKTLLSGKGTPK